MDLSVAATVVLAGLILLRVGLIFLGALMILRPVRSCPACFRQTVVIRKPILNALLPMTDWRWCPSCRWAGLALKSASLAEPHEPPPGKRAPDGPHWTPNLDG